MPKFRLTGLSLAACLVVLPVLTAAAQQARPLANPRDALQVVAEGVAARDAESIAAMFAEDAVLLIPGQAAISGREAIRQVWADNLAAGYSGVIFGEPRTERGQDRAAMLFIWEATIRPSGAPEQRVRGRTMAYFVLTPQGWLISADMWQPIP